MRGKGGKARAAAWARVAKEAAVLSLPLAGDLKCQTAFKSALALRTGPDCGWSWRHCDFHADCLWQCLWHVAVAVVAALLSCLSLKIVFIMPGSRYTKKRKKNTHNTKQRWISCWLFAWKSISGCPTVRCSNCAGASSYQVFVSWRAWNGIPVRMATLASKTSLVSNRNELLWQRQSLQSKSINVPNGNWE